MKSVKLVSLHLTNYKGIKELSQQVDGNHMLITGGNGKGKTTILEVIDRAALRIDPKDMADIPIRIGSKNANTKIIWGVNEEGQPEKHYLVETNFTPRSTPTMKVVDLATKMVLGKPVESLRNIIGETYDVTSLMSMGGEEQFREMVRLLGAGAAFSNMEASLKQLNAERKSAASELKILEKQLSSFDIDTEDVLKYRTQGFYKEKKPMPVKPELGDVTLRKFQAEAANKDRDRHVEARQTILNQIAELQTRLANADQWLEENPFIDLAQFDKEEEEYTNLLTQHDEDIRDVERWNNLCDQIKSYKQAETDTITKDQEHKKLVNDIKKLKSDIAEAVTKLPINEIVPEITLKNEYDEETEKYTRGLYYGDLPLNDRQISYGRLIVVLAKLSSFINAGKLNFIHIDRWNLLDNASKKDILDFAKKNPDLNVQFGIEEVTEDVLGIKLIDHNNELVAAK